MTTAATNQESQRLCKSAGRVKTTVDQSEMSALATISTPAEDRSRDVVNPLGIWLENYDRNPAVFFDHGMSGIYLPIATSREPNDGSVAVFPSKAGVSAKSWFSQSLAEAQQVFALICEGIINATSINLIPRVAKVRAQPEGVVGGWPGLAIEQWELLEWSWVGIPDNPEAVGKILSLNRLADWPIVEPIRKYLAPFAPAVPVTGRGFEADPADAATLERLKRLERQTSETAAGVQSVADHADRPVLDRLAKLESGTADAGKRIVNLKRAAGKGRRR
jgi:hypothetical protein